MVLVNAGERPKYCIWSVWILLLSLLPRYYCPLLSCSLDVLTFLALSFSLSGYSSGFVDNTEPPRGNREDNTLFFIRRDAHDEDFLLCLLLSSPCFTAHALRCYTDIEATQITRCKESEGFRTCFTKYNDSKFFFFSNHNLVLYFNWAVACLCLFFWYIYIFLFCSWFTYPIFK